MRQSLNIMHHASCLHTAKYNACTGNTVDRNTHRGRETEGAHRSGQQEREKQRYNQRQHKHGRATCQLSHTQHQHKQ